jgi:UDP-N-acetylglucosamine transferase subunit ALG13
MLQLGWKVTLAGEGPSLSILTIEFPELPALPLKGYGIKYPKNGFWLIPNLLLQVPKIARTIRSERKWLEEAQKEHQWDLIISDNRYGLSIHDTKCIFITHQLWVLSGWGNPIDKILNKRLHNWIKSFDQCWIPDEEKDGGIAGLLSHPPFPFLSEGLPNLFGRPSPSSLIPCPLSLVPRPSSPIYIGPLSRLSPTADKEGDKILILLSGPEPQRSLLEEKIIEQIKNIDQQFLVVRGLPTDTQQPSNYSHIEFKNHLSSTHLSEAIAKAKLVICRSGYSSIMDLLRLRKKAILIPTPGQTEQLYLAKLMKEKKWFVVDQQNDFQLNSAIPFCLEKELVVPTLNFELHKQVLSELVTQ